MEKEINFEDLNKFKEEFNKNKQLKISKNAVMHNGVFASAFNSEEIKNIPFTFSDEIKDIGSITHQKQSGRCWMFSGLNVIRIEAMKKLGVKDFEFSEVYLMFFDKLEKANYQLEQILSTLDEEDNSRTFDNVIQIGSQDGGYWSFFVDLIKKYGIVPKSVMEETYSSSNSYEMDAILNHKLAQFSSLLRKEYREGKSVEDLREEKQIMLSEIYKILTICLGTPTEHFIYEWKSTKSDEDKKEEEKNNNDEKWNVFEGTPKEFYDKFVGVDLDEYILITHAPSRHLKEYNKYTVDTALNMVNKKPSIFITVPLNVLKESAIKSIKENEAMRFDCDVGALSLRKEGYLDDKMLDLDSLFDSSFSFDKGESLIFRNTTANHAMTLVGVNLTKEGTPNRWKVENSWGGSLGKNGIFIMSDSWFDRFVYGIVIKKKFLNKETIEANEKEAILLPFYSPISL